MPPCGLMYYCYTEYQRLPFVYTTSGFDAASDISVEAPLPIFMFNTIPSVLGRTFFFLHSGHLGSCSSTKIFLPRAASDDMSRGYSTAAMCQHLHPFFCDTARILTGGTLESKSSPVPLAIGTLRSRIRTFRSCGFNLITLLVNAESASRYGLPCCPVFLGLLMAHTGPTSMDYLRSQMQISWLRSHSCGRNHTP